MPIKAVQLLAIIFTALALVPGGAHLIELPNKIGMPRDDYMIVQQIYRGWALSGFVLAAALAFTLALTIMSRGQTLPFVFAAAGFALLLATLAAFFIWVFPVNRATHDWTVATEDFRQLRAQWEYTHAANAIATFAALVATVAASLAWSGR